MRAAVTPRPPAHPPTHTHTHLCDVPAAVNLVRLQQHVARLEVAVHCTQQGRGGHPAARQPCCSCTCPQVILPVWYPPLDQHWWHPPSLHPPPPQPPPTDVELVDVSHALGHLLGGAQQGALQGGWGKGAGSAQSQVAHCARHGGGQAASNNVIELCSSRCNGAARPASGPAGKQGSGQAPT